MVCLSISIGVPDIVNGIYSIEDVEYIITGTTFKSCDDMLYACERSSYWLTNPERCKQVAMELWNAGKIIQTRMLTRNSDITPVLYNGIWFKTLDAAEKANEPHGEQRGYRKNAITVVRRLLEI